MNKELLIALVTALLVVICFATIIATGYAVIHYFGITVFIIVAVIIVISVLTWALYKPPHT